MSMRAVKAINVLAFVTVLVSVAAVTVGAQQARSPKPEARKWTLPRTPWGDPDLQGIWPGTAIKSDPTYEGFVHRVQRGVRDEIECTRSRNRGRGAHRDAWVGPGHSAHALP